MKKTVGKTFKTQFASIDGILGCHLGFCGKLLPEKTLQNTVCHVLMAFWDVILVLMESSFMKKHSFDPQLASIDGICGCHVGFVAKTPL